MDVYMYQAALLCEDCGAAARAELILKDKAPDDINDENTWDSDEYPKGPYADGGGEADCPQHCDHCGIFLENPLTSDGGWYVEDAIRRFEEAGQGDEDVIREWAEYYDKDFDPDGIHKGEDNGL